ncbi:hypothetical protein SEA_BOBBY_94 [Mycobacterium phage Bobby]|nr:hypothetical protein SEA_BOBBY_94 [Mycobacterium phage Bobby]
MSAKGCSVCGRLRAPEWFARVADSPDGLHHCCTSCLAAAKSLRGKVSPRVEAGPERDLPLYELEKSWHWLNRAAATMKSHGATSGSRARISDALSALAPLIGREVFALCGSCGKRRSCYEFEFIGGLQGVRCEECRMRDDHALANRLSELAIGPTSTSRPAEVGDEYADLLALAKE